MFRNALEVAKSFTLPIVMCRLRWDGKCSAGIGAFVVINEDGWVVTAEHILDQYQKGLGEEKASREYEAKLAEAQAIADEKTRRVALRALVRPKPESAKRFSAWWGGLPCTAGTLVGVKGVDLGVVKLEGFRPGLVDAYPVFKDPSKSFEPGTSLCKVGFPFHSIEPTWEEATSRFKLPPGATPMPRFPLEGMFTRIAVVELKGVEEQPPFPLKWVETSSPGLKGQSGGPTVDVRGTIWAIQCITRSYFLGFSPDVPGQNGVKAHQFLNVGVGVHPETMFGLFNELKLKYTVSDY